MSEIPFFFNSPTPKYFRESGLFKDLKNLAFVSWCFERCSREEHSVYHDGKMITLKPYQFIFGRDVCSDETGLTPDEVRTQQKRWESAGFLKKAPNNTPNRFTIYEWVLSRFCKHDTQQNPQQTPNKPPTNPHNQEDKKIRVKEYHQPQTPSSQSIELIDDFPLQEKENSEPRIEIYKGVFLTQAEIDECVKARGSLETVERIVHQVHHWPGRRSKIQDWVTTVKNWKLKNQIKHRLEESEELGQKLASLYGNASGWRCEVHRDTRKDLRGLLFYCTASTGNSETLFFDFCDYEFKDKVSKVIREKKMQLSRLPTS